MNRLSKPLHGQRRVSKGALAWAAVCVAAVGAVQLPAAGDRWVERAELFASDGQAGSGFGHSVALSGDWLAVGAPGDGQKGAGSGAVYLFGHEGDTWDQKAKLTVDRAWAAGAAFGHAVAMDGETLVVGARDDDGGEKNSGSAYVFGLVAGAWVQQDWLTASDAAEGDSFGCSVAMCGGTIVVGAYAQGGTGSAYVFQRGGSAWTEADKLVASDAAAGDHFGYSVAVSDGTIAAGAWGSDGAGSCSGSAYVFEAEADDWTQTDRLLASDASTGDRFGRKVAICGGDVVVTATGRDPGGVVYVFGRDGSDWLEAARITAGDVGTDDEFGCHVAADSGTVVVGASKHDGAAADSGAAYVFAGDGSNWTQSAKLTPAAAPAGECFGGSVCLDGDRIAVGAAGDDARAGRACVFERMSETAWQGQSPSADDWLDASNWTAGLPAPDLDARIGNGGTARLSAGQAFARALYVGSGQGGALEIAGGTLRVCDLHIEAGGAIRADANSAIEVTGDFDIRLSDPGRFELEQGAVRFLAPAEPPGQDGGGASVQPPGAPPQLLEVAGTDFGPRPEGWEGNFAIGKLVIAPGAVVRLIDGVDNDRDGAPDAVYVEQCVIEPHGRIDLNGSHLYYRNDGPAKRLFYGDADLDGDVDFLDYIAAKGHFGTPSGAAWCDGDTDGDGDVDFLDYVATKGNFGLRTEEEAPPAGHTVPEPAAAGVLLLGAMLALPRLRRRRGRSQAA